jgi:tetratricopeptide (TPR) repeat protein
MRKKDPMAVFERGNTLAARGDVSGAIAQYEKAIGSGHPPAVVEAGIKLGIMRKRLGDHAGAVRAYRAAMDTGYPERAPVAAFLLGGVLSATGRFREATSAYQYVINSRHDLTASAHLCLAEMIRYDMPADERDLELAAAYYERAIATGDPQTAPKAMIGMGEIHQTSNPDAAIDLYQRALDSGHIEAAPVARRLLRALRESRGERTEAAPGPSMRRAAGDSGCYLVLDADGAVRGLWFEDMDAGDACSADPARVNAILYENDLRTLMSATYFAGPDGDRGGYLISFHD